MTTPINKILINQIQNLSNEELANVSASLSAILGQGGGGGGEPCASAWRPTVTDEGVLSWTLTTSTTTPMPVNITGPQGIQGETGPQGPSGTNGKDGAPGVDGISPTISTSIIDDDPTRPQGGTHVVISGASGEESFDVWNGIDGAGTTMSLSGGKGIQIDHPAGTTEYCISVSADYISAVSANTPLSGDGSTEHPLGIDMSSAYSIDGAHGITAIPNTADNKVIVQMTDDVWAYYQRLAASANIWDSASAISNKSKTVINNSVNTITTENSGTSATISAVEYKVNASFQNAAPKQLFVVQDDSDIYTKLSEVNGKGSLFFVCSAI